MPNSANSSSQMRIKKTIIHLLDTYKRTKYKDDCSLIEKELDSYCENNLFKNLITVYRKNESAPLYESIADSDTVTFIIPLRIDSKERRSNLSVIIEQLLSINNSEIIILEADKTSGLKKQDFCSRVQHHFVKDESRIFHRTKYLNKLLDMARSAVVGIWDTDVLVAKEQIEESIRQIKGGRAIMSFPYDGRFYDLSPASSDDFRMNHSLHLFEKSADKLRLSFGAYSVGGAFFVNRDVYRRIGGENENFCGWGAEDIERVKRAEILGFRIHRSSGAIYHLYHPRNNSGYENHDAELNSLKELIKVSSITPEELADYIDT
jgi:predicted glycosyltransferase involved in capsule biosynthesis